MTTRELTIHGDNTSWTITDFRHWEGMKHFSEDIRRQVNTEIRQHIKNSLLNAITSTKKQISYNTKFNRRYGSRSLVETLGNSLQFGLKKGANQFQSDFIIGSYDKDENAPSIPTGVRGSGMTKDDKSLTEIYEEGQSPFKMKGFIGAGATDSSLSGYVKDGQYAPWKTRQDARNRVFIAEGGYGQGQERDKKTISQVTHRGWRGVGMMNKLHENVRRNLELGKQSLKTRLEEISSDFKSSQNNADNPNNLAYFSFKGQ